MTIGSPWTDRRFVVWVVASVGSLQVLAVALLSLAHGIILDAVVYAATATVVFAGVAFVETIKGSGGP